MTKRGLVITLAILFGIPATIVVALLGTAWYIEHLRIMDAKPAFDPLVPLRVTVYHNSLPFFRQAEYVAIFSADSGLSDENAAVLASLTMLPEENRLDLFLETPRVTDASVPHLKAIHNLASLNVSQTSISAEGIAELQASLPKTTIVHSRPRNQPD